MQRAVRPLVIAGFLSVVSLLAFAQQAKPGVLNADEIKRLAPGSYFFAGQSASVQTRNTVGLRGTNNKLVLAGLVDTSGYATDVAQKYQGFFITEGKLNIEGSDLQPGQYGFGFSKEGKFLVMNVAADDLFSVPAKTDDQLAHPVPLKMVEKDGSYNLYAGKHYVTLKPE
jgi:hypothetical protein